MLPAYFSSFSTRLSDNLLLIPMIEEDEDLPCPHKDDGIPLEDYANSTNGTNTMIVSKV
jgi:hypothetical protein